MPVGTTRGRIALMSAAGTMVLTAGLVGCGGSGADDAKPAAATSSPAAKKAAPPKTSPKPSPAPALGLVDDEESADAAKAIVVKVLDNDTVTAKGQPAESVEAALGEGGFDLTVDTPPEHGTAKVDGATIVYTSARGHGGEDRFTYRLSVLDAKSAKGAKGAGSAEGATGAAGADTGPTGTAVVRITVAAPAPTPTPTPVKTKKPEPPPVSYANCAAVKAAGAAPIRIGEPGYGPHLDRDGDGTGCEWSSGGSGGSGGGSSTSGGSGGGGSGSTYYQNCTAVRAAGADPIRSGDPGYGRHLDRDGDGVACE